MNSYLSAKKLYVENRLDEALKILSSNYEKNPAFHQNAYLYGKVLYYSDLKEKAAEVWADIVKEYPYNVDVIKDLSRYYIALDRLEDAEEILKDSLEWSSEDPTLLYLLAKVQSEKKDYEQALVLLSQADAYLERQVEIPLEQARLYQQYGFYKESLFSINKAISLVNENNPVLPALRTLKEKLENEQ